MTLAISSNVKRGSRGGKTPGSPYPKLQRNSDLISVPVKNSASTPAFLKARHWTAVEPEGARCENEVPALERSITKRGCIGVLLFAGEPALGISRRIKLRQCS